jgi:hypothetical protein
VALQWWPTGDGSVGLAAVLLPLLVLTGVLAYFVMLLALWRMSGRPDGAEAALLGRVRAFTQRRATGDVGEPPPAAPPGAA